MEYYCVSFLGHRELENALQIEQQLERIIVYLLHHHAYVELLIGRDGEYDLLVSSVIRRCKRDIRSDNSALIWVLPYVTTEYLKNEESFRNYYDEIIVCEEASLTHFKGSYQMRNRKMVDRSDLIVFCVQHECGGA